MPKTKEQKKKIIDKLKEKFEKQKIVLFVDFKGLKVKDLNEFKKKLKESYGEMMVAKKTLLNLASKEKKIPFDVKKLEGQIAVIFGLKDQILPAKIAYQFSKLNEKLKILGGIFEGNLISKNIKFAIIVSRFNEFISNKLLSGAIDGLVRHGAKEDDIEISWVPGSFEIPLVAKKIANLKKVDAVICLGAVIRGDTPHFDYVASEISKGIAAVSLETGVPVIFGVLTTDTIEQAIERAGTKSGNKGFDAAVTAIEMVNLIKSIK